MISAGKGTRLVNSLVNKGLVKIHQINLGGRGSNAKFLEITKKGYDAIAVKPKQDIGRGAGFIHGFWQQHISSELRNLKGIKRTTVEGRLNDKFIDILAETENEKIAVEIEMAHVHAKENVMRDIEAGCSKVFVGCKDKLILNKVSEIAESFSDSIKEKVVICIVYKIIEELKKYLELRKEDI
jgi:hypothetical protein